MYKETHMKMSVDHACRSGGSTQIIFWGGEWPKVWNPYLSKDSSPSKNGWFNCFFKIVVTRYPFLRVFLPYKQLILWFFHDFCEMGPSSKDFFDQHGTQVLRIFGENVTHLGSTSLYALACEYSLNVKRVERVEKRVKGVKRRTTHFWVVKFHSKMSVEVSFSFQKEWNFIVIQITIFAPFRVVFHSKTHCPSFNSLNEWKFTRLHLESTPFPPPPHAGSIELFNKTFQWSQWTRLPCSNELTLSTKLNFLFRKWNICKLCAKIKGHGNVGYLEQNDIYSKTNPILK